MIAFPIQELIIEMSREKKIQAHFAVISLNFNASLRHPQFIIIFTFLSIIDIHFALSMLPLVLILIFINYNYNSRIMIDE